MKHRRGQDRRWLDDISTTFESRTGVTVLAVLLSAVWWVLISPWPPWRPHWPFTSPTLAKDAVTTLALLAGGAWTFYQFGPRRAFESALELEIKIHPGDGSFESVTFIEVTAKNSGNRRINVSSSLTSDEIAANEESIEHPVDLEVRRMRPEAVGFVDWWNRSRWNPADNNRPHVSLLDEYETREHGIEFFMEPGELIILGRCSGCRLATTAPRWCSSARVPPQRNSGAGLVDFRVGSSAIDPL